MKRHQALHGLSSEHHHGLVWARWLNSAAEQEDGGKIAKTVSDFLTFWQTDLSDHFRKEEDILFPYYYQCRQEASGVVLETLRQHVVIRGEILLLEEAFGAGRIEKEHLVKIADLLKQHVRFEERQLFEEIQKNCSEALLQKLGKIQEMKKTSGE